MAGEGLRFECWLSALRPLTRPHSLLAGGAYVEVGSGGPLNAIMSGGASPSFGAI